MLTPNADYVTRGTVSYCIVGKVCFLRYDISVKTIPASTPGIILVPNIPLVAWRAVLPGNEWDKTTGNKQILLEVVDASLVCYLCDGGYYAGYLTYPTI